MTSENGRFRSLVMPNGSTRHLFFGGKGGVGKTALSAATAVWFADHGYNTTVVSTDPTVSLSAVFGQKIGGTEAVSIRSVPNLRGLNINPNDSRGVFQGRLNGLVDRVSGSLGGEMTGTPCLDEMATFDQFVSFLDKPESEVVVFDTAPTGKTLRELAMPFDWAGFLQKQISDGKKLARLMDMDDSSFAELETDRLRYEHALSILRDRSSTVFSLVLLPEKLPIEESQSAIAGLQKLGIGVQGMVVNQVIPEDAIKGNRFLAARARLQSGYLEEIGSRFSDLAQARLPLLEHDISDVAALRMVGQLIYGQ
jgi:arsenite-transporting ATPase